MILSGDLYHSRKNYLTQQMPQFNANQEKTRQSMQKIETRMKEKQAKLIIQHEPMDINTLPKIPDYLN